MFLLQSRSEQAVLMAIGDFNEQFKATAPSISKKCYSKRNGVFEILVSDPCLEKFRQFIFCSRLHKQFFEQKVVEENVVGFRSAAAANLAVEEFNRLSVDYYIDPSFEIERVRCEEGTIYLPLIEPEITDKFFEFVRSKEDLKRTLKYGREKCLKVKK